MEKLIELLNDYEPYIQSDGTRTDNFWWYVSQGHSAVFPKEVGVERIISKSYGFIKWLVDNDKIELHELSKKELATGWSLENNILDEENTKESWIKFWTENLLMLLTIQDEPLEFLINILK